MATAGFEQLTLEVEDGLARLTMNRPDRLNSMTNRMAREAGEALTQVAADESVRVLVLTGAGRSFCPGADINAVADGTLDGESLQPDEYRIPVQLLHEMPAVTVALVNGPCAGAGMMWACACDLRIATRRARFNTAFLDVGVAGDMGGPWTLTRLVGAAKARDLFMIPDKFDADEAQRIGLVVRVFDDDEFDAEAAAVVDRLLAASPPALRNLKANFLDAERMELGDFVVREAERHAYMFTLPETRAAFVAKASG